MVEMDCKYFQKCGGCSLYGVDYETQLQTKLDIEKQRFKSFFNQPFDIIRSKPIHFRNRAEFRIYKKDTDIFYSMNSLGKSKQIVPIDECLIVDQNIYDLMPILKESIKQDTILKEKLFMVEFLSTSIGDMVVTLIYHKRLDDKWIEVATILQEKLNIKLIGRSRKQKIVLSDDFVSEEMKIGDKIYKFQYQENSFTQPNSYVNHQMISWVLDSIASHQTNDLCELYCGSGNFTIALSDRFHQVLATEISKSAIKSAKTNMAINNKTNIKFVRLSSEEFATASNHLREFRRLKEQDIEIDKYNFSHIFVDPPRAGLDKQTIDIVKKFDNIIYISCNPQTLYQNLIELDKTHKIERFALFDQFAYTNHIECGVILRKSVS